MLKIKDSVDLKELEKLGLKFNEQNGRYEYIERNYEYGQAYIIRVTY